MAAEGERGEESSTGEEFLENERSLIPGETDWFGCERVFSRFETFPVK